MRASLLPVLSLSHLQNLHHQPMKPLFFLLSFSTHSFSPTRTSTPTPNDNPNPLIINYLIKTFGFSENRAKLIFNRFSWINFPEKPQSAINYLLKLGFSEAQIRSSVINSPQVLFMDIEKTLKPKIEFFQEVGFVGSDLGKFISKNSCVLTFSLSRRLRPCIEIIKKILVNDNNNEDLIRVLKRCSWIIMMNPQSSLLCNVAILESFGIFGSQLSMLLKQKPRIFAMKESKLRELVSGVVEMGFSVDSRMLVHALQTISGLSDDSFRRKIELFQSFGFSEDECMKMFRKAPVLLRTSEEKLKLGIEFYMNTMDWDKLLLVRSPTCLMYSIKDRVIPRYRVLQIIKSKNLLKKARFTSMWHLTEEEFLEKFISRFREDAMELLVAYKGHLLNSAVE